MHSTKVFLALSLILTVAFAKPFSIRTDLQGDDLVAAKDLLTRALGQLPGPKYKVVNWFSAESGSFHKYVVDVTAGSHQNECTFKIWQKLPAIENGNQINMQCQGGYELNHNW